MHLRLTFHLPAILPPSRNYQWPTPSLLKIAYDPKNHLGRRKPRRFPRSRQAARTIKITPDINEPIEQEAFVCGERRSGLSPPRSFLLDSFSSSCSVPLRDLLTRGAVHALRITDIPFAGRASARPSPRSPICTQCDL